MKNVPKETWAIVFTAIASFIVKEIVPAFVLEQWQSLVSSAIDLMSMVAMLLLGVEMAVRSISVRVDAQIERLEARIASRK